MTHLIWSFLVEAEMNIFTPIFNPDRSIAHLVLVKGDGDWAVRSHSRHTDIQGSLQKNVCKIEKLLAGLNHLIKHEVESNAFIESKIKMALCIQGTNIRNSSSLNKCILYSAVWLGVLTWTKQFLFHLTPFSILTTVVWLELKWKCCDLTCWSRYRTTMCMFSPSGQNAMHCGR